MEFSDILNLILGGGLLASVIGLFTLKATVRKANAEAEKAKAEAEKAKAETETVRIDNADHATRLLVENIVKPLKDELNATRKDLQATKREMARLRKSIDSANGCKHRDECPVLYGLREQPKERDAAGRDTGGTPGQHRARDKAGDDGSGSEVGGDPDIERGQPP